MQTEVTQSLLEKIPLLSLENQQDLLRQVDEMLGEKKVQRKTVWEMWEERLKEIPQEELDALPADASENLDHYLYGAPKK